MEYSSSQTIPRQRRERPLFGGAGSFWSSVFQQPAEARDLLTGGGLSGSWENWQTTIGLLAQDWTEGERVECREIPFQPSTVFTTGTYFYNGPPDGQSYTAYDFAAQQFYSRGALTYFALPYAHDILPLALQGNPGRLTLGLDYFWQPPGYLVFRQDPRLLFPRNQLPVLSGVNRNFRSPMAPLWRLPQSGQDQRAIDYFRISPTPGNYLLALAATLDLAILDSAQVLRASNVRYGETTYTFDRQTLRVGYPHEPLVVGETYPADLIIGEGLHLFQSRTGQDFWWRQLDWHAGVWLNSILPGYSQLWLPDAVVPVYATGDDAPFAADGSATHIRWQLSGDPEQQEKYWQEVSRRETSLRAYLNSLTSLPPDRGAYQRMVDTTAADNAIRLTMGLPPEPLAVNSLPGVQQHNALDLFFQSGAGNQCLVLVVDYRRLKNWDRLSTFLSQEPPGSGGAPIILVYGQDLPLVYAVLNGTVVEPVIIQEVTTPVLAESPFRLDQMLREIPEIRRHILISS